MEKADITRWGGSWRRFDVREEADSRPPEPRTTIRWTRPGVPRTRTGDR